MIYLGLSLPFLIAGAVVGRWWVLLPAALVWPLDSIARALDVWGHGNGDLWLPLTAFFVLVSVGCAAVGVLVHKVVVRAATGDATAL